MSDLISRQAVLEEIDRASREYSASFFKGLSIAADIVAKQPSAERPKGKWEQMPYLFGEIEVNIPYCSECGMSPLSTAWHYPSKFCPNCGAEMESEK